MPITLARPELYDPFGFLLEEELPQIMTYALPDDGAGVVSFLTSSRPTDEEVEARLEEMRLAEIARSRTGCYFNNCNDPVIWSARLLVSPSNCPGRDGRWRTNYRAERVSLCSEHAVNWHGGFSNMTRQRDRHPAMPTDTVEVPHTRVDGFRDVITMIPNPGHYRLTGRTGSYQNVHISRVTEHSVQVEITDDSGALVHNSRVNNDDRGSGDYITIHPRRNTLRTICQVEMEAARAWGQHHGRDPLTHYVLRSESSRAAGMSTNTFRTIYRRINNAVS